MMVTYGVSDFRLMRNNEYFIFYEEPIDHFAQPICNSAQRVSNSAQQSGNSAQLQNTCAYIIYVRTCGREDIDIDKDIDKINSPTTSSNKEKEIVVDVGGYFYL